MEKCRRWNPTAEVSAAVRPVEPHCFNNAMAAPRRHGWSRYWNGCFRMQRTNFFSMPIPKCGRWEEMTVWPYFKCSRPGCHGQHLRAPLQAAIEIDTTALSIDDAAYGVSWYCAKCSIFSRGRSVGAHQNLVCFLVVCIPKFDIVDGSILYSGFPNIAS